MVPDFRCDAECVLTCFGDRVHFARTGLTGNLGREDEFIFLEFSQGGVEGAFSGFTESPAHLFYFFAQNVAVAVFLPQNAQYKKAYRALINQRVPICFGCGVVTPWHVGRGN